VFGDAAVASLAAKARTDLGERADRLLASERARFDQLLAGAPPQPDTASGCARRSAPWRPPVASRAAA
jgi:hypothetical protein